MKSNIFIPSRIRVGFQERKDTYTQRLAYITYYDQNNKLRKEFSWDSWRDKKIEPVEYENSPMSGFVLNKKAGGYATGWNHRQTYCRVYDSRNFEFEISVPNLLYILENTNSIKGKGLEGEFVYGWDGTELLLMPVQSPDYAKITEYNELIHNREFIKAKDLKVGATYRHKNNSNMVYMGRFDYWTPSYGNDYQVNQGKQHFFFELDKTYNELQHYKSISGKFIDVINEDYPENYAELVERLDGRCEYSPIDSSLDKYIKYESLEEFEKTVKRYWRGIFYAEVDGEMVCCEASCFCGRYQVNKRGWPEETLEGMFIRLSPMYKEEYLANGNFYRSSKEK